MARCASESCLQGLGFGTPVRNRSWLLYVGLLRAVLCALVYVIISAYESWLSQKSYVLSSLERITHLL